jgi:septal ring-binding cell division protein DamX
LKSQVQIQPEKVAATAHLGALMDEVRPLEMTTRVVTAGSMMLNFVEQNLFKKIKSWTIELFKVQMKMSFKLFTKQADRKNFIYFRLSGENQIEQYVLAYGVFKNDDEAKGSYNN